MLIITGQRKALEDALRAVLTDHNSQVAEELGKIRSVSDLTGKIKTLREQVEKLEIEKGRREEEGAKREREIEHKIGLERKRQEFEIDAGKREATLSVREENLKADRARFEEQMKFHDERFTAEVNYLKTMLAQILERVPNVTARLKLGGGDNG